MKVLGSCCGVVPNPLSVLFETRLTREGVCSQGFQPGSTGAETRSIVLSHTGPQACRTALTLCGISLISNNAVFWPPSALFLGGGEIDHVLLPSFKMQY